MSNAMFLENFQTLISVVEDYEGEIRVDRIGAMEELIAEGTDVETASDDDKRKAMAKAKNRYLAVAMLTAADVTIDSQLLEDLENYYTK
jgi:hypothetical protein